MAGGSFSRHTGHTLELGRVVLYRCQPDPETRFEILACRDGIRIEGIFPWVGPKGIDTLQRILARAVKHHQHLALYPIGTHQEVLDEAGLIAEENVDALAHVAPTVIKGNFS